MLIQDEDDSDDNNTGCKSNSSKLITANKRISKLEEENKELKAKLAIKATSLANLEGYLIGFKRELNKLRVNEDSKELTFAEVSQVEANGSNRSDDDKMSLIDMSLREIKDIYYFPKKVESKNIVPEFIPKIPMNEENKAKLSDRDKKKILQNLKNQLKRKDSSPMNENRLSKKSHDTKMETVSENRISSSGSLNVGLSLGNLENLPKRDYNDEFKENYDQFSPSWRAGVDKMI